MSLLQAVQSNFEPGKTLLNTFGTLAEFNNQRKRLELVAQKQAQDALFESANLELKQRMFGLDAKVKGLQMKVTQRKIDEADRVLKEENDFEDALSGYGLSADTTGGLLDDLESDDPAVRRSAHAFFSKVAGSYSGNRSVRIQQTLTQYEGAFQRAEARATSKANSLTSAGNLAQRKAEFDYRKDKDAKKEAVGGDDKILFPRQVGGGSLTKERAMETLGKAYANPDDPAAAKEADIVRRKLLSIGSKSKDENGKEEFTPFYSDEDLGSWAREGAEKLYGATRRNYNLRSYVEPTTGATMRPVVGDAKASDLPVPAEPSAVAPEALIPQVPLSAADEYLRKRGIR